MDDKILIKNGNKRTIRLLVALLFKERLIMSTSIIFLAFSAIATVMGPRIIGFIVDGALASKDSSALFRLVLFYAFIEVIRLISTVSYTYLFSVAGQKVMHNLRIDLFEHFLKLPISHFDKNPSGQVVTRLTTDVAAVGQLFTAGVVAILEKIITVLAIIIALFLMDPLIALVALLPFPILFLVSVLTSRFIYRVYRSLYIQLEDITTNLSESLLGIKILKLFNSENSHLKILNKSSYLLGEEQRRTRFAMAVLHPLVTMITAISIAGLMWIGGPLVVKGDLQLGVLVTAFSYLIWLFWPIIHIIDKWNVFLSGLASCERIFESLQWSEEEGLLQIDKAPLKSNITTRGEIIFENLSFSYDQESWIFKDFSFTIKPGERIGIVGISGSGKSSLIALLRRLYDPQSGRILIDGVNIRDYDKRTLRSIIGCVEQDIFLFGGKVRDNLKLFEDDNNWSFENELANNLGIESKLDLEVGERGLNLSSGERQLLSFIRTASTKPSIWILDEASSNLDQYTEKLLFNKLEQLSKAATLISIAHRVSSVRNLDRILVLHHGKVLESGTHEELLKLGGFYSKLCELQQGAERAA